jgi:hypothetical protein
MSSLLQYALEIEASFAIFRDADNIPIADSLDKNGTLSIRYLSPSSGIHHIFSELKGG